MELLKYIGRPYEEYHCFDLVKEFYRDHYNLDLKDYFEGNIVPERKVVESLIVSSKGDFEKVSVPTYGDIIVIRLFGYACHVGVFIGDNRFLHSVRGTGSCVETIEKYKNLIEGYYRHREYGE